LIEIFRELSLHADAETVPQIRLSVLLSLSFYINDLLNDRALCSLNNLQVYSTDPISWSATDEYTRQAYNFLRLSLSYILMLKGVFLYVTGINAAASCFVVVMAYLVLAG
jgi:hypothetical protein